MWFAGTGSLERAREHKFKNLGPKGRAIWVRPPTTPYASSPLVLDPHKFAYAAARSSIVGLKLGLRGQIAGLGLASASLAYLDLNGGKNIYLHRNFGLLKDFVGTSLLGTIGAAISYLEMLDLGYVWQGHWEDCIAGSITGSRPDFVFAKTKGICLVDAKGTTSDPDRTAKDEWRRQIYNNRAVGLKFGGTANEGRVIATSLSTTHPAELVTAYGSWNKSAAVKPTPSAIASVQRANFIDAFFLIGLPNLAWKLLGINNVGRLTEGGATLANLKNDEIYVGPIRMTFPVDNEQWVMQPYCKKEIVEAAIRYVSGDQSVPMQMQPLQDGLVSSYAEDLKTTYIDGPDGIGAIFKLAKND